MNVPAQTDSSPADENGHLTSGSAERTSFWTAVGLVAGREMKVKMMSKAFVVTTVIVLGLLMLCVLLAPRLRKLLKSMSPRPKCGILPPYLLWNPSPTSTVSAVNMFTSLEQRAPA